MHGNYTETHGRLTSFVKSNVYNEQNKWAKTNETEDEPLMQQETKWENTEKASENIRSDNGLSGKRIGVLHSTFLVSGGIERMPLMEAAHLSKNNHVSVFCTMYDKEKCFSEMMKRLDVRRFFYDIPFPRIRRSANHLVAYLANRLSPRKFAEFDVLLCNHQPSIWIAYYAKKRYGVPYVYYAQGISRELYPRKVDIDVKDKWDRDRAAHTGLFSKIKHFKNIDRKAVLEADAVTTVSHKISSELEDIFGRKDVIICNPCVDTEKFKPLPYEATKAVLSDFAIKRPFILTTNRHEAHKKLDWLVEMMPIILKKHPDATLVITGKKNDYCTPSIVNKINSLGLTRNVRLTGEISDLTLVSLYNQADVYAYSPPDEDFGLGPVEAMSCGTVPVAWNAAGPKESIVDGENGLLAKPFEIPDMAEKVLKLIDEEKLRERLRAKGRAHVNAHFTWKRHMDIVEGTIMRILEGGKP